LSPFACALLAGQKEKAIWILKCLNGEADLSNANLKTLPSEWDELVPLMSSLNLKNNQLRTIPSAYCQIKQIQVGGNRFDQGTYTNFITGKCKGGSTNFRKLYLVGGVQTGKTSLCKVSSTLLFVSLHYYSFLYFVFLLSLDANGNLLF
jgi:Leucine-rich repeat (LRR) protein